MGIDEDDLDFDIGGGFVADVADFFIGFFKGTVKDKI
jgi:hypothetical protein